MYDGEARGILPECGFTFREWSCVQRGDHECVPRWKKFYHFSGEMLTHVKGAMARKPLWFDQWQIDDLIRPIFGQVRWSDDFGQYVRCYTIVWFETARKTGKSHFLAAVLLYLLTSEGEEASEIYGAARTKLQAAIVYNVAKKMVKQNPLLWNEKGGILKIVDYQKRIVYPATESAYVCIAADDDAALGQDPACLICDEIVAWRDRTMWDSIRTGMGSGARAQPLMIAATTPGTNLASFAKRMHDAMLRILLNPERSPHTYVLLRNAPRSAEELETLQRVYGEHPDCPVSLDVFDEHNWRWPQPGLGKSVTVSSMREQAKDAQEDPEAENAFRVFKMAQWTAQTFLWMPMHRYDASSTDRWFGPEEAEELEGRKAYAGMDLSARSDLTSWCLLFPREVDPSECVGGERCACHWDYDRLEIDPPRHCPSAPADVLWRFWVPEEALAYLDTEHDGMFSRWVEEGWLEVHSGPVIEYEQVYSAIARDAGMYDIQGLDADEWSFLPVIQRVQNDLHLGQREIQAYKNTFDRMSPGMNRVKELVKQGRLEHHGNPVARFCFECVEVRRAPYNLELIRPDKPQRENNPTRIDAVPAVAMAANCWTRLTDDGGSAYEDHDLVVA